MELQPSSSQENSKGCIVWSHDDIYSQVMGKECHGCVRGLGFGPTPKSTGSTSKSCERLRMVEEERTKDKETILELKETVQTQAEEMSTMKDQLAFLLRHVHYSNSS